MKKIGISLAIIIIFIVIYFLQMNFFSWFTIAGVKPNLFVMLVLFISLYAGMKMGVAFGVIFGFAIDFLGNSLIGGSVIALGAIGFFTGYLEKNLSKDSKITIMLMVMTATASYETFMYIYNGTILLSNIEILEFIKVLLIELVYNTLLTIILYPLMQKIRL